MRNKVCGFIFAVSVTLSACKNSSVSKNNAPADIKQIVNSSDVTLVDVRIPEQYKEGTAKDAINIPLAEIQNNIESLKGKK
ncbi:rhodanese-like domain-containing protein [Chryseobacterium daecheongense]|nr:rhodanese-like domain-containing protein [Chryseobacterium daecheongense]